MLQSIANNEDKLDLQKSVDDLNIVELSDQKSFSTKPKILFATNFIFLAVIPKNLPVGCKDVFSLSNQLKRADSLLPTFKTNKERYKDNLCLISADFMNRTGIERSEEETPRLLIENLYGISKLSVENFPGVAFDTLHILNQVAKVKFLVQEFEVTDSGIIGEFDQRILKRFSATAKQVYFINHVCYVKGMNKVFKFCCCSTCARLFNSSYYSLRHPSLKSW